MPSSMTGYGTADGPVSGGRLAIEARSVNHRHLNVHLKFPHALQALEVDVRNRLRERLERGHVTITARWLEDPPRAAAVKVNLERARAVVAALRALKASLELAGEIDVGLIARQPEVLASPEEEAPSVQPDEVFVVLDRAVGQLVAMRRREGAALAGDLAARLAALEVELARIEERAPARLDAERERLRRAVTALLDGQPADEARLAQEIAFLADKLDISEEVVRLRTHIAAARAALAADGAVGRPLGFLGQEMLRETNTIGSKANDAAIAQAVMAMKGELERFREQVENIE